MAALSMTSASLVLAGSLSSASFSSTTSRTARLSSSSRSMRLVVKANQVDDIKEKIGEVGQQIKDSVADVTNSKKGAVREVTNANKPQDSEAQAVKILNDVQETVGNAVDAVKNALGGDEGYDSTTQKEAFTTPQREAQKAKYNLDASNTRPPQKTIDLANPFNKKN